MKKLLQKTLLVAAMLGVGASAWADDPVILNPTGTAQLDLTENTTSATSWNCNQASVRNSGDYVGTFTSNKIVITKFDASSTLSGKTLTNATLKFHSVCTTSGTNSTLWAAVLNNESWAVTDVSNGNINVKNFANYSKTAEIKSVDSGGADVSLDITTWLDGDDDKVIALGLYTATGREQQITNLTLEITAVDASTTAFYTVNFVDQKTSSAVKSVNRVGNIGETVTLEDTDDDPFTEAGIKYVYVSDNASSVEIVEAGTAVVTVTVKEADQWDWTINAVDAEDNVITTAASGKAYVGDSKYAYFPRAFLYGGKYYTCGTKTSGDYYRFTLNEASPTATVTYTEDATIAYYVEGEDLNVYNRRDGGATTERLSNGAGLRVGPNGYAYTDALTAGTYTIILNMSNSNSGTATLYAHVMDAEGNFTDTGKSFAYAQSATPGEQTIENVVIPEGYKLAIRNISTYNSNASIDYVIFKRTGDATVPVTIAASGYSTIASAYALDFANATDSEDGKTLEGYIVSYLTASAATLTNVNEAPANTGIILKGTAGETYSIPVLASAASVGTNKLKAAVTATTLDDGTFYIMKGGKLCKVIGAATEAARTVPAGKAYLLAEDVPAIGDAPVLDFIFGDVTAIETVQKPQPTISAPVYNLQGQRINQPRKGLYIVNGKKVILK